jgi:hypothetical protein
MGAMKMVNIRTMKKAWCMLRSASALLLVVALLGLVSCGEDSGQNADDPEAAVTRTLDALKARPYTEIANSSSIGNEYLADVMDQIAKRALDFDYALGEADIDGDRADVEITITTYPFGQVFEDSMDSFLTNIAEEIAEDEKQKVAASGISESDAEAEALTEVENEAEAEALGTRFAQLFSENLEKADKTYTTKATVTLLKSADGRWTIDVLSAGNELENAIYGGIVSAAAEFSQKAMDEMFIRVYTDAFEEGSSES